MSFDVLFPLDELGYDFHDLEIEKDEVVSFSEGQYHLGEGSVVRFMGRKA